MSSAINILISAKHQVLKKPFHLLKLLSVSLTCISVFLSLSQCTARLSPEVCRRLSELMLLQITKPLVLHNFAGLKKMELDVFWQTQCNHSHMSCPAVPSLKSHCLSIIVDLHLGKIALPQCDFNRLYFKQNYLFYSYII